LLSAGIANDVSAAIDGAGDAIDTVDEVHRALGDDDRLVLRRLHRDGDGGPSAAIDRIQYLVDTEGLARVGGYRGLELEDQGFGEERDRDRLGVGGRVL
jgi:hypothetical protein